MLHLEPLRAAAAGRVGRLGLLGHQAFVAAVLRGLVNGTLTALNQVVVQAPGIVAATAGAEFAVAYGSDGATVSASLNPVVDTAIRQTISGSVHAIRPVLPLTRLTVRQVTGGVLAVEDATVVAMGRMVRATVHLAKAVVTVSSTTLAAMCTVADSAVTAMHTVLAAVRTSLENLTDEHYLFTQTDRARPRPARSRRRLPPAL